MIPHCTDHDPTPQRREAAKHRHPAFPRPPEDQGCLVPEDSDPR